MFRKSLTVLASFGLALTLVGCAGLGSSSDALPEILASGELRVGISADQPPFNMHDRDGGLMGFDVDLAQALADAMGLELRHEVMPFNDLLPALEAHEIDVIVSGLTITPGRNARVPFAGPYFVSGTAALAKPDGLAKVRGVRDMNDAGLRFAATEGTTNEAFAFQALSAATLVSTADFDSAVQLLLDGKVDAVLADFPLCKYASMKHAEAGLEVPLSPFTIEPLGIAMRADSSMLVNLVQNYLVTLERTGLLAQLKAKWLGGDEWLAEMP